MWPVLQVALDLMHLKRGVEIAHEAVGGGVDWIEVGTPLIKSEGAESIRTMRREFPGKKIVADTKTMDVGSFEVEIAAKAGADVITVMGLADDSTISEAVMAARKYGAEIMIDMLNVPNVAERSKEVEPLGVSYICLHIGIDRQMRGSGAPVDLLKEVAGSTSVPLAVAGGITAETVGGYVKAGASIIIVGGGIIKTEDVTGAAANMKKAMSGIKIESGLAKKYNETELFDVFSIVSTPNVSDAYHKQGVINGLTPHLSPGQRMIGRALTVQTANGDWAKPVEAIDRAKDGDIIVISAGGGDVAVWGELATESAKIAGVRGVVIDGAIRDICDIRAMGFPSFSKHVVPNAGEPKGYGGIGIEVTICDKTVRTGDWIIGDENGLMVVPKENAVEIANRSLDVRERENRTREEIRRGSTLSKVNELEKWESIK
ncbi:MAG: orotidine 5'-phosphate decarboxylase [Methanomassiliicoccaceae archaeon]|nr:orotidine 5'-phosphate decarboxylase [Methanomassiliicoccaceae archaeon]